MEFDKLLKLVVEKHSDGYVAYPIGLKGTCKGLRAKLFFLISK